MKVRPVEVELHREDGRTDMMNITVAFRNFANAPKNSHNPDLIESKWPRF